MNNTDVDLAIYYDDDQLRKHCASVGTDVDRYRAYTENAHFLVQDDTNGKEARHRYVDKLVSQLWYNHNVSQSREMWLEKHVTGISRSGSDSIFARVRQLMDHDALPNIDGNDGSDTFTLKRSVARAFHLDFMGGLKSYRQDFVRHLLTLPKEEGERMWNYVAQLITSWERLGRIPDAIQGQFPQTLDDAARYYVVHTVSGE